jgi:sulfide:quinone oxidoreductase
MAHVVVVGAGVGGVPAAYELRKKLAQDHRVTPIGSSPWFEFRAQGWLAPCARFRL